MIFGSNTSCDMAWSEIDYNEGVATILDKSSISFDKNLTWGTGTEEFNETFSYKDILEPSEIKLYDLLNLQTNIWGQPVTKSFFTVKSIGIKSDDYILIGGTGLSQSFPYFGEVMPVGPSGSTVVTGNIAINSTNKFFLVINPNDEEAEFSITVVGIE